MRRVILSVVCFAAASCAQQQKQVTLDEPDLDSSAADAVSTRASILGVVRIGETRSATFQRTVFVGFEISVPRETTLTIDVRSPGLDAFAHLYGPRRGNSWREARPIQSNDDFAGSLDARLQAVVSPGVYLVVARDLQMRTGAFSVSVHETGTDAGAIDAGRPEPRDAGTQPPDAPRVDSAIPLARVRHPGEENACGVSIRPCVGEFCSVSQLAIGSQFCATTARGSVMCGGDLDFRGLGSPRRASFLAPQVMTGFPEPVVDVSVSVYHACALGSSGSVYCWGAQEAGRLGDGVDALTETARPVRALLPRPAIKIASAAGDAELGGHHTCAILDDCSLACWGNNAFGQLGMGERSRAVTPPRVIPSLTVRDVATTELMTIALGTDGNVYTFGGNSHGLVDPRRSRSEVVASPQRLDLAGLQNVRAVAGGGGSVCALRADGVATCWSSRRTADTSFTFARLESGGEPCGITFDGVVHCNLLGQSFDTTRGLIPFPFAVTGFVASGVFTGDCALSTTGQLFCAGAHWGPEFRDPRAPARIPSNE